MRVLTLLICLFGLLFTVSLLQADIIYLQDGSVVKGKIVDQDESKVVLESKKGIQVHIPWFKIKKIEKGGDSAQGIYKEKLGKIPPGDAEGHYQLGLWLLSINLGKEAHEEFTKAIIIDPNHHGARRKLGYILTPQGWKFPTEEAKKDPGEETPMPVPSTYQGNLSPEVRGLLKALQSRHASERQRAFLALTKLRKEILQKFLEVLFGSDETEKKKVLRRLEKADPNFVSDFEKDSNLTEEKKKKATIAIKKFLQETFDRQIISYIKYQQKILIKKLKSLFGSLNQLVSLMKDGKSKELRKQYLKKWEEARKEALRVIFDKSIYPDENHGRVGQPTVDEKVKAMKQVYEFFDILLKRSLDRILKLSPANGAKVLDLIKTLKSRLKDYSKFLSGKGEVPLSFDQDLAPRVKALISYRAGKTDGAKQAAAGMGAWGQTMLRRMIAQKIMAYNKKITSQKNSPVSGVEAEQIRITNEYRISMGRTPLEICPKLVLCARKHSTEMVQMGYFAHESPVAKNRTPSMRAQNEGHDGSVGENIYTSSAGATAIASFQGWYNSSGHHRNMLSDGWSCIGVGHHTINMTQNFGRCKNCPR